GIDPAEYEKFLQLDPEWASAIRSRTARPTLRTAYFSLLQRRGLLTSQEPEPIRPALLAIYFAQPPDSQGREIGEHLIRFDESIALWRFRHVQMVERMIGMKVGTGGSLGVSYLKGTLRKRFFPELWEARTDMGGAY